MPIPDRISLSVRIINLIAIIFPFIGFGVGIALLWGWGFSWLHLGLLLAGYALTVLGVTMGFHRLFTHRSFDAARPVQVVLVLLGSMAAEGPLVKWVALHRRHHQHSDSEEDPHSPHLHRPGVMGWIQGLWHAHIGWLMKPDRPGLSRYVPDLQKDGVVRWLSRLFGVWVLLGLLIPTLIGGLVTMSWTGALLGFLWGGLARIFLVHHVTWSINSVCHLWGSRPFHSRDHSRNNVLFGVIGMGEGWHNNHHAFPTSARHGLRWWQLDISWILIRGLAAVGLAWNLRLPSPESLLQKRSTQPASR